jgi:hypothetical protein
MPVTTEANSDARHSPVSLFPDRYLNSDTKTALSLIVSVCLTTSAPLF